jgi:hypothetical protein
MTTKEKKTKTGVHLDDIVSSGTGASLELLIAMLHQLPVLKPMPSVIFPLIAEYMRTLKWVLIGGNDYGRNVICLDIAESRHFYIHTPLHHI